LGIVLQDFIASWAPIVQHQISLQTQIQEEVFVLVVSTVRLEQLLLSNALLDSLVTQSEQLILLYVVRVVPGMSVTKEALKNCLVLSDSIVHLVNQCKTVHLVPTIHLSTEKITPLALRVKKDSTVQMQQCSLLRLSHAPLATTVRLV